MGVYLLYPGACFAVFSMFKCRQLDHGAEYLIDDMRQPCKDVNGEYDGTYRLYWWLALACVVVYAVGIPVALGLRLYTQREEIRQVCRIPVCPPFRPACPPLSRGGLTESLTGWLARAQNFPGLI
eukprot:SAG22_NODE_12182_length_453_cov_1.132768_1_plen_124_part_01